MPNNIVLRIIKSFETYFYNNDIIWIVGPYNYFNVYDQKIAARRYYFNDPAS